MLKREITLGSVSIGSASEVVVAYHFQQAARKASVEAFSIRSVFSCEIKAEKRVWIQGVYEAFGQCVSGSAQGVALSGSAPSVAGSAQGEPASCSDPSVPGFAQGVSGSGSAHSVPGSAQRVSVAGSPQGKSESPCLFCDICELANGIAWCETHKRMCDVPSRCIFVCCTSCKDLFRLKPGSISLRSKWTPGGSCQTFHGMMAYIEKARPAIVIFENVEDIKFVAEGEIDETNLDIVLAEFANRGYECQQMFGDSSKYGVPQRRKRFYIVAMLVVANSHIYFLDRSIHDTFETLRGLIRLGQREPPCASQVLYEDTDAKVVKYLAELQSHPKDMPRQCYSVHNAIATCLAKGGSWSTIRPPVWAKTSQWLQTVTTQQKHVLVFSLHTDDSPVLFRDVVGTHSRVRTSPPIGDRGKHVAFTMLPNQVCFVFKRADDPRLLLGDEAVVLQGFLVVLVSDSVSKTPHNVLQDIAGNMVSNPVLLLLMSAVACIDWGDGGGHGTSGGGSQQASELVAPSREEVDEALHAMSLLVGSDTLEDEEQDPAGTKSRHW